MSRGLAHVVLLATACHTAPAADEATSSSETGSSSTGETSSTSSSTSAESSTSTSGSTSDDSSGEGSGIWHPRAPMPTPRSELGGAVVGDRVYVPGGYGGREVLEAYDPVADTWVRLADLPEPRDHAATAALDGIVYVVGGVEGTTTVLAYDPELDAWEFRERLPHPRTAAAAIAHAGALWIVGGNGAATDDELRAVLRYDPGRDAWTSHAPMPAPREHLSGVAFEGRVHAIAGRWQGTFVSETAIYDPLADAWLEGTDALALRSGFQAAVLDTSIFVCGGEIFDPEPAIVDAMEVFADGTWQPAPALPVGVHGHAVVAFDGALLVIGGSDVAGGVMNMGRVWAFVP